MSFARKTILMVIAIIAVSLCIRGCTKTIGPVQVVDVSSPFWGPHEYMVVIVLEEPLDEEILKAHIMDALSNYNLNKENNADEMEK